MNAPDLPVDERRKQLVAALEERARLLRPSPELIERAVRRALSPAASGRMAAVSGGAVSSSQVTLEPLPVSEELPAKEPEPASTSAVDAKDSTASLPAGAAGAAGPAGAADPTVLSEAGHDAPSAATESATAPNNEATGRFVALKPGRIVAGYRIETLIGQGGMGQVYRATQLSMNRAVAFKVLSPKLASNPRFRERFLREARSAGRLHHPNLIGVHDVGEADGLMYFSMELVEGTTLKDVLKKHGKAPEARALEIVRQALEALRFAHAGGVVHRDIKPENLMLTNQGMVKVADLGLSRSLDDDVDDAYATQAGTIMGTPHYMAPEQGRDAHAVDHRADLYAVGATLYHLVCGVVPFPGETPMEVVIKTASQPLKFPEPGPSPGMRVLITKLMAKKPAERVQTAAEALELISRLRRTRAETDPEHHPDAAAAITRARGRRVRRTMRRAAWIGIIAAVAVVALLLLAGLVGSVQWGQVQSRVSTLTQNGEHRYRDALAAIDAYANSAHLFGASQGDIQRLRTRTEQEWDSWAFLQANPVFNGFQEQLRTKHLPEAWAALKKVDDEWRSPGVRHDLDEYEHQLDEAMLAAERSGGPTRLPGELMARMGEFWTGFTAQPASAMEVKDGAAHFTGSGTATSATALSPQGGAGIGAGLRRRFALFTVTVRLLGAGPDAADAWGLALGPGRSLVASRQGLVMREMGKPERVLAPPAGGGTVVSFKLRRIGADLDVQASEIGNWIPLADPNPGQLSLVWNLAAEHAAEVILRPNYMKHE